MDNIIVKELKEIKEILLTRVNHKVIGQVSTKFVTSQSMDFDDIDYVKLTIPKEYTTTQHKGKTRYPLYDEFKNERYLEIDGDKYVIKEIYENKIKNTKEVTAYGIEKKLEKINFTVSNIGLTLLDPDEDNKIYAFNDELYKLTGWRLGHVDETVRYSENGKPKMRMQEDTDTSFYSFITETISEQWCCVPTFDKKNKLLNLYDEDSFGDVLKLVLTKDNYIKDISKTSNSSDIVTRLKLKGNEEKCDIRDVTPTGFDYIENYSYFVRTHEMSDELIDAIVLFEKITPDRIAKWQELSKEKVQLTTQLSDKKANETIINTAITSLNSMIKGYEEAETDTTKYSLDDLKTQLLLKEDELADINDEIVNVTTKLNEVNAQIDELNVLCTREGALDYVGHPIFTNELLDELKEFVYYDTYSDDSFIEAEELLKTGERVLASKCMPTFEFTIDSANFMQRLIMNPTRKQWHGKLGLGDVISLYDKEKDEEEFVYFVGWEANYEDYNLISLNLTFSNKKTSLNNGKTMADLLKKAKLTKKAQASQRYLLNDIKYQRDNNSIYTSNILDFDFVTPPLVSKIPVEEIQLSETSLHLDLNSSYTLMVSFTPKNATNQNVVWISSDTSVLTVNDGKITGVKRGIATITCVSEDGLKKASCEVNVGEYYNTNGKIPVTSIRLNKMSYTMNINGEFYIVPTIIPLTATNRNVTFASTDTKVAMVTSEGLVVGVSAGNCAINVFSSENPDIMASLLLTVEPVDEGKHANLDNALILGSDRVLSMKSLGALSKMTVVAKSQVSGGYFYESGKDILNDLPKDPGCVIVMLGATNPSKTGVIEMTSLLDKLRIKYKSKQIYVVQELPVSVEYDKVSTSYEAINKEIEEFNNAIFTYSQGVEHITIINGSDGIVENNLLITTYSDDGFNLNMNGAKSLYDNMITNILTDMNTKKDKDELPDKDDEKPSKPQKPDDSLGENPSLSKPTTKYVCTVISLNIRNGAGTNYKVLGTFSEGEEIDVYSISGDWAKIKWKNLVAYCSAKYIEKKTDDDKDDNIDNDGIASVRDKIVKRANDIVNLRKQGKAWYSQAYRTVNYNKKNTIRAHYETVMGTTYKQPGYGKWGFDCSSLVGCAYDYAGYSFMRGLSCSGGTLQAMARKHNATAWRYADNTSLSKCKPGDIVMWTRQGHTVTKKNMFTVTTSHTAIYAGNGYIIEAAGYQTGIVKRKRKFEKSRVFFFRIEELSKADKKAVTKKPSKNDKPNTSKKDAPNCYNEKGVKDGNKYIYKFTNARCTAFGGNPSAAAGGVKMTAGKSCAAHNMPYGTKIYIPKLKGKYGNKSGIYTVHDTGGYCFDFDLYLADTDKKASRMLPDPIFVDAYVISWGKGKTARSFTSMAKFCVNYYGAFAFHDSWTKYMKKGGCTINFWKFNDVDKDIKNQSFYKKL